MKNLVLVGLTAFLAVPAMANHWNFECGFGNQKVNILINNKKAKLVAPFAKDVFTFTEAGHSVKVYKTSDEKAMLLAPKFNYQTSSIPMGETAEFTYEVAGPNEALILECETRPTLKVDPDLK